MSLDARGGYVVLPRTQWDRNAALGPLFDRLDPLVSRSGPHVNRRMTENILAAGLWIEHEENLLSDVVKLIVARR